MAGRPDILVIYKYLFINGYEYDYIASAHMRACSFVGFFLDQLLLYASRLQNLAYSHEISYRQPNLSQEQIYALVWPEANVIRSTKVEDEGNWGSPRFFGL